jgi:integrase
MLLSMQWRQIRETPKPGIFIPAAKATTDKPRTVPLTPRLKAVLSMRRIGPDGKDHAPDVYVSATRSANVSGTSNAAWDVAVLKAHGHAALRGEGDREGDSRRKVHTANLTVESRATLRSIDLHFHDLRREAGSRWLDAGVSLEQVRDWLGHTTISQTRKYLAVSEAGTDESLRRVEAYEAGLGQLSHKPPSDGAEASPPIKQNPL